jgi:hypothetical protein
MQTGHRNGLLEVPYSRRRFVQVGLAGAAAIQFATLERLGDVAYAAGGVGPELSRSSYMTLTSPDFSVGGQTLSLVAVEDLAIAAQVPSLRDSDRAFSVRFEGAPNALEAGGTQRMSHPDFGAFSLFVSPIDQTTGLQEYEAVVDRTVKIAGVEDDGAPAPVAPGARAVMTNAAATPAAKGATAKAKPAPVAHSARLLRASIKRTLSLHSLIAEVELGGVNVRSVSAVLSHRGHVVSRTSALARRNRVRLTFRSRSRVRPGRYDMLLVATDRSGHVTRIRRSLVLG